MAVQDLQNGKEYLVYINTTTAITATTPPAADSAAWKMLMCINNNALAFTRNGIDATSKCTDGWADQLPGDGSWSVTAEGQSIPVATADLTTQQSGEQIMALAIAGTSFWAAIFDPEVTSYRVGVVYISALNETYNNNAIFSFNATLTGRGALYTGPKVTAP